MAAMASWGTGDRSCGCAEPWQPEERYCLLLPCTSTLASLLGPQTPHRNMLRPEWKPGLQGLKSHGKPLPQGVALGCAPPTTLRRVAQQPFLTGGTGLAS